jgi:NADPH2:quinone reductase
LGGDRFRDSIRALKIEGRLLILGFAGGSIPTIETNRLLLAHVDVIGVAWGNLIQNERDYMPKQWAQLMRLFAQGHIRPVDGSEYPLERARDALIELDRRMAMGKITLAIRS